MGLRSVSGTYKWTTNMTDIAVDSAGNIFVLYSVVDRSDGDKWISGSTVATNGAVHSNDY